MINVAELANKLQAEAVGDKTLTISGVSEPATARPDQLALAMSPAWAEALRESAARAAVVWPEADWQALGLDAAIIVRRPRLAMAYLTQALDTVEPASGVHPTAIVDGVDLPAGVSIGPYTVIAPGATIGAGCVIGAHVSIASTATLGAESRVFDGARIMRNVSIGERAIIHANAVIGGDGFSFVTEDVANVERARASLGEAELETGQDARWIRIHSIGGVRIGNNVEIGSATAIDAGTIRPTQIGNGCKFDNFCHIGHNVVIGNDCLFAGFGAVAGSTRLGNRVVMGGQGGIADNLTIGDDVVITGGTKILSNVASGKVMMGYPAVEMKTHVEMYKAMRRLPRFFKKQSEGKS